MTSQTIRPWLGTVARLVLGVVWVWASLAKIKSPRTFVQAVRAYDATPEWLSKGIGYGLPVLELALGVLLIVGVAVRLSAAVSAVLHVVFLIGLIQAAARGLKLTCGCFGGGGTTDGSTSYLIDILRGVALLALALYLVRYPLTRWSVEEYLARNDYVQPPSAKRLRMDQGRRKYEQQVAAAQQRARGRTRYIEGSLAGVVVLVSVIGIGVQAGRAKIDVSVPAQNASVSTGVVYGKKAAAVVDVYEDFGCPNCLSFEKQSSAQLDKQVKANLVQLRFHPISILDDRSPNQYSTRAANAAICASDAGVDQFVSYHNLLYGSYKGKQVQPREGTAGASDSKFVTLAQVAKFSTTQVTAFQQCVSGQTYLPVVQAMTEAASKKGINATPTILINGTRLASYDNATVQKTIKAADAKGPAPSPSPTSSAATSGSASVTPPSSPVSSSPSPSSPSSSSPAPSSPVPTPTVASTRASSSAAG